MWDFLTKKCGIFGIEGGTKLWDFQHRGGDFRPLTSGHTVHDRIINNKVPPMVVKKVKNLKQNKKRMTSWNSNLKLACKIYCDLH